MHTKFQSKMCFLLCVMVKKKKKKKVKASHCAVVLTGHTAGDKLQAATVHL